MIREICKDETFLAQKAEPATADDLSVAQDLLGTLEAHKEGCAGMAASSFCPHDVNHDANWITVEIYYSNEKIKETYRDSCVLTWELDELACGIKRLLNGVQNRYESDSLEPYLQMVITRKDEVFSFRSILYMIFQVVNGKREV